MNLFEVLLAEVRGKMSCTAAKQRQLDDSVLVVDTRA